MRTRGAGESALLLLDAVDILNERNVAYAVIGAIAASVYGAVRASMDADLVLFLSASQATTLEQAFKAAGFGVQTSQGDLDDPIPAMLKLNDAHGNRVDLLMGLRGMEQEAFNRTVEIHFERAALRFIGREDFIAMKLFAGGPQDLVDARRAFNADAKAIDMNLLRRLVGRYGAEARRNLEKLGEAGNL